MPIFYQLFSQNWVSLIRIWVLYILSATFNVWPDGVVVVIADFSGRYERFLLKYTQQMRDASSKAIIAMFIEIEMDVEWWFKICLETLKNIPKLGTEEKTWMGALNMIFGTLYWILIVAFLHE